MSVNPAALSKVNWTQVVAVIASILVIFGIDLPVDQQLSIVAAIQAVQAVATIIFRTWFTAKPAE